MLQNCSKPKPPPPAPPEVGIVVIEPQSVTLTTVLPGRTTPFAISDVRPQVNGILQSRLFHEGANVRKGQILYQIDPATYRAAYDQARAQLSSAEATLVAVKVQAERYADLVKINGVSRQEYDTAESNYLQDAAIVRVDAALVQSAKINLGYTRVVAPISGRIGKSAYTQGALVTAAQSSDLTTVQALDPICVDIPQSTSELLTLRHNLAIGALTTGGPVSVEVSLKLDDGSDYPLKGRLQFTDVTVDQATGAVNLRAVFPNPKVVLLPGMYVRAVVVQGGKPAAILAPQQGVTHNPVGDPVAMVVGTDGKAQSRTLKTDGVIGDKWLVTDGLKAGDRLIVEGLQRVKPGAPVHAVLAGSSSTRPATPAPTPPR